MEDEFLEKTRSKSQNPKLLDVPKHRKTECILSTIHQLLKWIIRLHILNTLSSEISDAADIIAQKKKKHSPFSQAVMAIIV